MKASSLKSSFAVIAALVLPMWMQLVQAAPRTWDVVNDGATITDGAGNWDNLATANWNAGPGSTTWNNSTPDDATFGAGGTAGTVTLTTLITAGNITFDTVTDNYTITGNTLILASSIIAVNDDAAVINSSLAGNAGFTKTGTGTLTIGGSNIYTGTTTISAGKVAVTSSSAFGSTVAGSEQSIIQSGAALDINGTSLNSSSERFLISGTGADGSGAIINAGAAQSNGVRLITLQANATIGGTANWGIRSSGSNAVAADGAFTLTKTGTNTVTFAGGAMSVRNIVVNQGTFAVEGLSQSDPATVINNTNPGSITINSAGTVDLIVSGTNPTISKPINLSGGTITVGSFDNYILASSIILGADGGDDISSLKANRPGSQSGILQVNGVISGAGNLSIEGAEPNPFIGGNGIMLNNNNTFTGGVTVNTGAVLTILNASNGALGATSNVLTLNGGQLRSVAGNLSLPATRAVVLGASGGNLQVASGTITVNGVISGSGGLTAFIANNGAAILTANNTYTGGTTINGGTLQLGNGGTTGDVGTGNVNMFSGSTLLFNRSNSLTVGAITGNGTVVVDGGGELSTGTLPSATFQLKNGTLTYTGGNANATLFTNFAGGARATVNITNAATTLTSNTFDGGSAATTNDQVLTKQGSGTLSLAGNADNAGGRVIVDSGTVLLGKVSSASVHAVSSTTTGSDFAITLNSGGTVKITGTGGDQILTGSRVVLNGGTFDFNGGSEGWAQLTGNGGVITNTTASTTSTITLGEGDASSTFGGVIQDGAGLMALTKTGAGTLILTGANTYTGPTAVNGGTLRVNGSLGNTAVTVGSGAVLDGTGGSSGPLVVSGTLSPGNSPGVLNTGGLTLTSTATLALDINGTSAGTGHDQVNVTGTVNLDGAITLSLASFAPNFGDKFFIVVNDLSDAITGIFAGLPEASLFTQGGQEWQLFYAADSVGGALGGGNDVALLAVPEPNSLALFILSGAGFLMIRCRRRENHPTPTSQRRVGRNGGYSASAPLFLAA